MYTKAVDPIWLLLDVIKITSLCPFETGAREPFSFLYIIYMPVYNEQT